MAIDTSIYGMQREVKSPSMADAMARGANLSTVAMQNQNMQMQQQQAKQADYMKKAEMYGSEMSAIASLPPEQQQGAYMKARQQLVQNGIATPDQAPEQFDPNLVKQMANKYRQMAPAFAEQKLKMSTANLHNAQAAALGNKQAESTAGQRLPADKVLAVSEGQRLPNMLADLEGTIEQNQGDFGPFAGRLGSLNPYNEKAQTIDAQMRTASQTIGRHMEGGVLRKEDEEKYRKMLPTLSDSPEVARNKLALVNRMLQQKQTEDVKALKASGYDTAAFDASRGQAPGVPSVLSAGSAKQQSGGGLIANAQASEKSAPTAQDKEAIAWAQKNFKHPKAREILKMHGMM